MHSDFPVEDERGAELVTQRELLAYDRFRHEPAPHDGQDHVVAPVARLRR
eukprot:IDg13656t1